MLRHTRVHVSLLLEGECGYDKVLALRFRYNAELVALLKKALWAAREGRQSSVGGWSLKRRCWHIEGRFWPKVRRFLLDAGVRLHGPEANPPEPAPPQPQPEPPGFFDLTQWDVSPPGKQ